MERTLTDTFLVALSAANTLHENLAAEPPPPLSFRSQIDPIYIFADAAGRFGDACEKIDHAEEYLPIARKANRDIVSWALAFVADRNFDLEPAIQARREELAKRQFYIAD